MCSRTMGESAKASAIDAGEVDGRLRVSVYVGQM